MFIWPNEQGYRNLAVVAALAAGVGFVVLIFSLMFLSSAPVKAPPASPPVSPVELCRLVAAPESVPGRACVLAVKPGVVVCAETIEAAVADLGCGKKVKGGIWYE